MNEDDVSRVIQAFGRAALDPGRWQEALSTMSDTVGGVCCALESADLNTGLASMEINIPIDPGAQKLYHERIYHINPRVRQARLLPVGKLADDRHLLHDDDPHRAEFLDWLDKIPYRYILGAKIFDDAGHEVYFSSQFSKINGPHNQVQQNLHAFVIPHLTNFMELGRVLSKNRLQNELLTAGHFEGDRPFALLDRAGRLIECSNGFENVLRTRNMLSVRDGRLIAIHQQHRHPLEHFFHSILGERRLLEPPSPIRLSTPDSPKGIVLRAVPLMPLEDIFDVFRPAAVLTLTDLDASIIVRRKELEGLFGLTVREAEIAAKIAAGQRIEQIAADLAISQYTVKQHMKAIFGKMEIDRQSELIAIVTRL